MKERREIVDKMEELYEMGRDRKLPFEYVIPITDTLDWCLGDSDYLDTEKLKQRALLLKENSK